MIEPGKILQQRYRIDRQIGQGGMGAVYIATDERFGSTVAIKQTLAMGEKYRKAIEREARLLNNLKHPALPRVSDHFLEADTQFLVMEYIPGKDLSHMLDAAGKPFPVDQVLRWADQLLDALDFLHNQSTPVIHRDIKPQNLKLNSRDQIILLDFGLAKGNPTDADCQTAAKSIFGYSRNYASMEQIEGTGTDPRSDLYSLAATLFHLVTGEPPEDALTRAMSVLSGGSDPLEPATTIRPDMPPGISAVLQTALNLNAKDRPRSAAEMREMLRSCENYSHSAVPFPSVAKRAAGSDFLTQKTRLMPTGTGAGSGGFVLDASVSADNFSPDSPDTRADVSIARPASKKGGSLKIASVIATALLICSTALGVYLYRPSLLQAKAAEPAVVDQDVKQGPTLPDQSAERSGSASEQVVSSERAPQKTKSNLTADNRSTERPRIVKASTNDNVAIQQDQTGSVYVGHNVWVGHRKLPDNVYIDGNGMRRARRRN